MPVYNCVNTVDESLNSVVSQDYPIDKIKIFDNASTDGTLDILKRFADQHQNIEIHTSNENIGLERNLGRCMQAADNDYCAMVHADDLYGPTFVSESVAALEANPECIGSFTGAVEISSRGEILKNRFLPNELEVKSPKITDMKEFISIILKYSNFITCPSVMVHSHVFRDVIQKCDVENFKSGADLEMWFRLIESGAFLCVPKILMRYRLSEASYSFRLGKVRTYRHDMFIVLDHYVQKYEHLLTKVNREDYLFLNLKDQAFRSFNIMRGRLSESYPTGSAFNLPLILKKMVQSRWHLKMAISILGIRLLSFPYFAVMRKK